MRAAVLSSLMLALALLGGVLLPGCGKKGPLYLPEPGRAAQQSPPAGPGAFAG